MRELNETLVDVSHLPLGLRDPMIATGLAVDVGKPTKPPRFVVAGVESDRSEAQNGGAADSGRDESRSVSFHSSYLTVDLRG